MPSAKLLSASEITHSAISVVSAIPAGRGVAIGIGIPCFVKATVQNQDKTGSRIRSISDTADPHNLVRTSVEYALSRLHVKVPRSSQITIEIKSKIPAAVGLKSSSAVSVATTKAIFELFSRGKKLEVSSILKSSCLASKHSGASLTGAFDDASASLLGGLVFTDNLKLRIIRHARVPKQLGTTVALLLPLYEKKLTSSIDRSIYFKYRGESLRAFDLALKGEIAQAMLLNSIVQSAVLGYSMKPVTSALAEGASAAGITGKGPAVAALCSNSKVARRVSRKWKDESSDCRVVITSIVQPGTTMHSAGG